MIRAIVLIAATVVLSSCGEKPSARAEKRYELVKAEGSYQGRCDAAREVERAYLEELDDQNYKLWKVMADVQCSAADLRRINGLPDRDLTKEEQAKVEAKADDLEALAQQPADEVVDNSVDSNDDLEGD